MKTQQKILTLSTLVLVTVLVFACKKSLSTLNHENVNESPVLPDVPYNYSKSNNDKLAALGRVLFYDKSLSLNNTIACSGCHLQSKAFCDNLKFSVGLENQQTSRNSPSIFAKEGRMFWDGRATNLSDLVMRPIKNHVEMKFENLTALASKISKINYYPDLFQSAFGINKIDSIRIQIALSEFLKNFDFSDNKFNRSLKNEAKLTATEEIGKSIFFGKGKCSGCHDIEPLKFPFPIDSSGTLGGGYGTTNKSFNIGLDNEYKDNGLGEITKLSRDNGVFMIPALLNVEYTAPYMHDGRFNTLEEVVEHYNSGIKNHPNLDFRLRNFEAFENMSSAELLQKYDSNRNGILDDFEMPENEPLKLGLNENEKRCLVTFLKTLSDPSIFSDKRFSNPFVAK